MGIAERELITSEIHTVTHTFRSDLGNANLCHLRLLAESPNLSRHTVDRA